MATITVRQLEDSVVANLKERAAARGTSMEHEAREILTRAVGTDWDAVRERLRLARARFGGRVFSDSAELIRQERDDREEWLYQRHRTSGT